MTLVFADGGTRRNFCGDEARGEAVVHKHCGMVREQFVDTRLPGRAGAEEDVLFGDVVRAFVACYFLFVALHYTARLLGLRARKGYSHAELGPIRSANGVHQILFRGFRFAILVAMAVRVPYPQLDGWLGAIPALETVPVAVTGVLTMLVALGLVDYCHSYLNDDWRSGTAGIAPGGLVTGGPYRVTRNPIFIGILLGQFGLFLAAPSLFTLVSFGVGAVVILRQADVEERDLALRFGATYARYRAEVPRFLPLSLGRFAASPR